MTFYELEKKCKRKRFLKIFVLSLLSILILVLMCVFYYFSTQRAQPKTEKKTVKKEVKTNKTKSRENLKVSDKTLKFVIPQINQINQISKKAEKTKLNIKKNNTVERNNTVEKNNTVKSSNIVLKTSNLPSYKTCISIASKYLKQKDFNNALKWAKYANIQNKKDVKSWIISAKALFYMGKKDEAVKLLKIYNTYYNNKEIQKLIKEMSE